MEPESQVHCTTSDTIHLVLNTNWDNVGYITSATTGSHSSPHYVSMQANMSWKSITCACTTRSHECDHKLISDCQFWLLCAFLTYRTLRRHRTWDLEHQGLPQWKVLASVIEWLQPFCSKDVSERKCLSCFFLLSAVDYSGNYRNGLVINTLKHNVGNTNMTALP